MLGSSKKAQRSNLRAFRKAVFDIKGDFWSVILMSLPSRTSSSVVEGIRRDVGTKKDELVAEEVKCYCGAPHTLVP